LTTFDILGLAGTAVNAIGGTLAAGRKGFDILGVLVIAVVCSIGGGTMRDLLLDRHPIFWLANPDPLYVVFLSSALTMIYVRYRHPPHGSLLIADAIGLALFCILGAEIAERAGMPWIAIVILGTVTGCAGGLFRDVLSNDTPMLFQPADIYATVAAAGILLWLIMRDLGVPGDIARIVSMVFVFVFRMSAIYWSICLPVIRVPEERRSFEWLKRTRQKAEDRQILEENAARQDRKSGRPDSL